MSTIEHNVEKDAADTLSAVRGWGSTAQERAAEYPCDCALPDAVTSMHRAVDIDAPPEVVFRWLCQLRVAPYSYDLLDNLGRRSPRTLTPGLEQLETGQTFMMIYELVDFEPGRRLTIASRRFTRAFGRQAITFEVTPRAGGYSRLVVKRRLKPPRGPHGPMIRLNLPVIDLIMTRKQLRTIKRLAEQHAQGTAT
jgi:hypothetical protein